MTKVTKVQGRIPTAIAAAICALLFLLATQTASAHEKPILKPTIVLVHGAWADASSFTPVTRRLQHDGYTVLAPPIPMRGLSSDAAYLASFLQQRTTGPVILVGHSYGGAVITNAALFDPDVKALVYINAFVPEAGESAGSLQASAGGPPAPIDVVAYPGAPEGDADLYFQVAAFPKAFANDLPAEVGAQLAVSQRPVTVRAVSEPSGRPAWRSLPSWYVLSTRDGAIAPSLQRFMAERAHSHTTKVTAGHLVMLSRPHVVTTVIERAARASR
jgi:pimeloyl-ACP methyl ester carboxylesterase